MGVSLQTYRVRIGNFQPKFKYMKTTGSTPHSAYLPLKARLFFIILFLYYSSIVTAKFSASLKPMFSPHLYHPVESENNSILHYGSAGLPDVQGLNPAPWPPPHWLEQTQDCCPLCAAPPIQWITSSNYPLGQVLQFNIIRKYLCEVLDKTVYCGEHFELHQNLCTEVPADVLKLPQLASTHLTAKVRNSIAKMINGNGRDRGMKIQHWNKGPTHLVNKHHEIEALININQPHVLGLSEANLHHGHDLQDVQHTDYDLHVSTTINNPQLNVARVVVYTHQSLKVKRRSDLEDDTISSVWLEVGLPRKRKILMCHAYREWKYLNQDNTASASINAQQARWSLFLTQWERALAEDKEVLVLMDANIDFLKWTSPNLPAGDTTSKLRPLIDDLFARIFPHGVSQLVTTPTRSWPGQTDSGLDHLYSNRPEKLRSVTAEFMGGSDHRIIKAVRSTKSLTQCARYVRKRCYKQFNEEEFCNRVKLIPWFELYMSDNVEQAVNLLTNNLKLILDEMAPVKTIQMRTHYAPWLSKETKQLLQERNNAHKTASESGYQDDWRMFRCLRNRANSIMKQEKKTWEQHRLSHLENNSATLWKSIKTWLNWKTSGPPTQLFHEGELIRKPGDLADTMNRFFIDKVNRLRAGIPPSNMDPLATTREVMHERECVFSMKPVSPDQVMDIIKHLKNSKSTGMDTIDTYIIKLVAPDILPAITHIVNLSIRDSSFPQSWKQAKVIPLLKKGDRFEPKNYRPVALLNILSKILERAVYLQLVEYLDQNNLMHPNHHGGRRAHSTSTALLQMYDTWVQALEEDNMAGVMMIDLSAAFDMVDHDILVQKLEILGLDSKALNWFRSYLMNRSQTVCIDGCLARFLEIGCGVPQGSVLGPLLYVLFTNDLPDVVHDGHTLTFKDPETNCAGCGGLVNFVDDATYTFACKDPAEMSAQLDRKYKVISEYMASNKLVINADKTHLLVMGSRSMVDKRSQVMLQAGVNLITPTPSEKLLGCNIHEGLKWGHHIKLGENSLVNNLTSRVNALSKMATNATFKTLLMAANGTFMSSLAYLIPLWGGTEGYLLKSLQVLQNRAARIVTKLTWFTPTRILLNKCKWLSINQLVFYHSMLQVYKVLKAGTPLYLFQNLHTEHPYPTRQATDGGLRYLGGNIGKLSTTQNSFFGRAPRMYNSVPAEIRAAASLPTFKMKLKIWVKENVPIE